MRTDAHRPRLRGNRRGQMYHGHVSDNWQFGATLAHDHNPKLMQFVIAELLTPGERYRLGRLFPAHLGVAPHARITRHTITDATGGYFTTSVDYETYYEECWRPHCPPTFRHRTDVIVRGSGFGRYKTGYRQTGDYAYMNLLLAIANGCEHSWTVSFQLDASPRLVLSTDPVGILALFAEREAPLTASGRRKAILHWVRAHHRKSRNDAKAAVAVRQHLRGIREFSWYDLKCMVQEPAGTADPAGATL